MKQPLVEGRDYYWQHGLVVFTQQYHLDRGYCCGLGCLHCPYGYEAVPEPKRSELMEQRSNKSSKT